MVLNYRSMIIRADGLMSTIVGDDIVLLNLAANNYVGLNPIGRRIWDILETSCRVDDLAGRMSDEFQGDPAAIAADVLAFVTELERDGLVRVLEE